MYGKAWEALASLSTVGELSAVLLSSAVSLPETAASLEAKQVAGVPARLGPGRLTHVVDGVPVRRLELYVLADMAPETEGPVTVAGVALYWRGEPVAVRDWPAVQVSREEPYLAAWVEWSVTAFGGVNE